VKRIIIAALLTTALAACTSAPKGGIATLDVQRLAGYWPKYINNQNQINADAAAIERSNAPAADKARLRAKLQDRYVQFQNEIAADLSNASQQVASEKHLTMVFTRQATGYGGIDITHDVEKILKIDEVKATPAP
jgi:Skp family chaperone for outer membrane proteins